jgi:hypothetical protein
MHRSKVLRSSSPCWQLGRTKRWQHQHYAPSPLLLTYTSDLCMHASRSILSAIGFSALQEWVFKIPGFSYGGWMTFITYVTFAACGWIETAITRNNQRHGALRVRACPHPGSEPILSHSVSLNVCKGGLFLKPLLRRTMPWSPCWL